MSHSPKYDFFAFVLLASAALPASAQEVPLDADTVKAAVLAETNAYRASKNLPQLERNPALEAAANAYAAYLAAHGKMGHTADGSTPPKRVSAQGYKWCFVSENVWNSFAKPQTTLADELSQTAMNGWKASPGHNANLLEKRAKEIGIGAAGWKQDSGKDIFRVVQVFAAPCGGKQADAPSLGERLAGALNSLR